MELVTDCIRQFPSIIHRIMGRNRSTTDMTGHVKREDHSDVRVSKFSWEKSRFLVMSIIVTSCFFFQIKLFKLHRNEISSHRCRETKKAKNVLTCV